MLANSAVGTCDGPYKFERPLVRIAASGGLVGSFVENVRVWVRVLSTHVLAFWHAYPLTTICVASMAVRVLFILIFGANAPPIQWGDDPNYDSIATRLVTDHVYVNTWYPPGYPLFLALVYSVFGRNLIALRLIQAALGAATCGLTYRLGRRLFGEQAGRLAGLLLAFYPGLAYMSWRIMAETLFIFLLVLALNLAIGMIERPRHRLLQAVALGLVVGLAQLVKSNLYVLPFLLVAWAGLAFEGAWRKRLVLAGTLAVSMLVVSIVTPIANRLTPGGGAAVLPGNAGRTLWLANNPLADGYYIFADQEPEGKAFIAAHGYTERLAQANEFEADRLFRELALLWIRENPGRFLVLCAKKLDNAFGLFPRAVTMEGSPGVRAVHILTYGTIAPFALLGMVWTRRHWRACLPLYLVLVSYVMMVLIFYGTPRFTIIVMPVLIVFASSPMSTCIEYLLRVKRSLASERSTLGVAPGSHAGRQSAGK